MKKKQGKFLGATRPRREMPWRGFSSGKTGGGEGEGEEVRGGG